MISCRRGVAPLLAACALISSGPLLGGDLVRLVRLKLSAGDLTSGEAAVDEYRRTKGKDPESLDATAWLARGAFMLGKWDKAQDYVAAVRRDIPREEADLIVPLGAAIEVEAKLRAARDGRGAALAYLEGELARAKDVTLRCRIRKNMNVLSLEGEPAPALGGDGAPRLADLAGHPVLLFLWAHGCGDCKAEMPIVARVAEKYRERGLVLVAPTRYYGVNDDWNPCPHEEEVPLVAKDWKEWGGPAGIPTPVDEETMVRYGVSATPTLVLLDKHGVVRLYTPTRMSESELSRRIEELLSAS
jgi:thiol-disulfide isomerase/thioredoxin